MTSKLRKFIEFDYAAMERICLMPEKDFENLPGFVYNDKYMYSFQDNNADILAVAHLDSVSWTSHFYYLTIEEIRRPFQPLVMNGQLDDRLGAYLIIDYLKQYNLKYDILLTTNEEMGASTAMMYDTDKQYNWMFSFDREGHDVVTYQYYAIRDALRKVGFKPSVGSYSDISELSHLACCGFNVGTGVHNYHSPRAYANLDETRANVMRFLKFWDTFHGRYFESDPKNISVWSGRGGNWGMYRGHGMWDDDDYYNRTLGTYNDKGKVTKSRAVCLGCGSNFNPQLTTSPSYCDGCSEGEDHLVCDICYEITPESYVYDFDDGSVVCSECISKVHDDGTSPHLLKGPESGQVGITRRFQCDLCEQWKTGIPISVDECDKLCQECVDLCI